MQYAMMYMDDTKKFVYIYSNIFHYYKELDG